MRKAIPIILLLMILFFAEQWFVTIIKKEHEVTYDYVDGDITFLIEESYKKKLGDNYFIDITADQYHFSYIIPNEFRKNTSIVKEIQSYQKGDTLCILPIVNTENLPYDIECSSNGSLYGYEEKKGEPVVQEFVSQLREKNISLPSWEEPSQKPTQGTQGVGYLDNFFDDVNLVMWAYRGVEVYNSEGRSFITTSRWDVYENNHGIQVGEYFVQPVYLSDRVFDFSEIQLVNVNTSKIDNISLPSVVSQNTYINGVVDNKVYYLDKDNVKQYEVNVETKKARLVGDASVNAQFFNGKWDTVNIYDLVNQEKKFKIDYTSLPFLSNEEVVEVFESESSYYFYTQSGLFYRLAKENPQVPVLLFHATDPNNVRMLNDAIYYISGDSVYCYKEAYGNRKILTNNEFLYNKINRIYVTSRERES